MAVLSDVVRQLKSEGIDATRAKVSYQAMIGRLGPIELDGANNRVFLESHIAKAREILRKNQKGRPCGRKPRSSRTGA